jgi:hypothetical protein
VPHVDLARGTEASMAACPAQVVSAGRLARYTEVQPQDHRRYIRCRHRAWHQRCGPCGVTAPAGRRLASGCRQGRTASCYPAACCPPRPARRSMRRCCRNRRDCVSQVPPRPGAAARNSDTATGQATCSRWPLARRCRSSKAASSVARPHSHIRTIATPFPGPRTSVPGSACDAPCARSWHAAPGWHAAGRHKGARPEALAHW